MIFQFNRVEGATGLHLWFCSWSSQIAAWMAASLAYYTVFSHTALFIIAIAVDDP
jgi:hypothetical protein